MSVKENGYNIFVVRGQYPVAKKEVKYFFEISILEKLVNLLNYLNYKINSYLRTLRSSSVGLHLNKSNVQDLYNRYFTILFK